MMTRLLRFSKKSHRIFTSNLSLSTLHAGIVSDVLGTGTRIIDILKLIMVDLLKKLIGVNNLVHQNFGSVLDKPPEDAIEPNEKWKKGVSVQLKSLGQNTIRHTFRPDTS